MDCWRIPCRSPSKVRASSRRKQYVRHSSSSSSQEDYGDRRQGSRKTSSSRKRSSSRERHRSKPRKPSRERCSSRSKDRLSKSRRRSPDKVTQSHKKYKHSRSDTGHDRFYSLRRSNSDNSLSTDSDCLSNGRYEIKDLRREPHRSTSRITLVKKESSSDEEHDRKRRLRTVRVCQDSLSPARKRRNLTVSYRDDYSDSDPCSADLSNDLANFRMADMETDCFSAVKQIVLILVATMVIALFSGWLTLGPRYYMPDFFKIFAPTPLIRPMGGRLWDAGEGIGT